MGDVRVEIRVASGSRVAGVEPSYVVPHAWTDAGIAVEGGGSGAHLLLTAVASCVLNDLYREDAVRIDGVLVAAEGIFDDASWGDTRIAYRVEVDSPDPADAVQRVLERVDSVAEIPRVVRGTVRVDRG